MAGDVGALFLEVCFLTHEILVKGRSMTLTCFCLVPDRVHGQSRLQAMIIVGGTDDQGAVMDDIWVYEP